ncbi:MAG: hypothetical protein QG656_1012 [Candidatus Hydrogenedentes bacterium]|nr:hypothetical protein [Candidatus Hydrogenedentota bacterium]
MAIVALVAAAYAAFVWGYPRVFPSIEQAYPDHFEANVAKALADGNVNQALRLAKHATAWRPIDPMTHTVYGQALLSAGQEDAARVAFGKVFAIDRTMAPDFRWTHQPYYFAMARLELGRLAIDGGNLAEAVSQFELARAYATLTDKAFEPYWPALYAAYSRCGAWWRALAFGRPEPAYVDALSAEERLTLVRACETEQTWDFALDLCGRFAPAEPGWVEARFIAGRAHTAAGNAGEALAAFTEAAGAGQGDAPYFIGLLKEQAGASDAAEWYLRTTPSSVYRPLALAKAVASNGPSLDTARVELQAFFEGRGAAGYPMPVPEMLDAQGRLKILAATMDRAHYLSGGRFLMSILWEKRQTSTQPVPAALSVSVEPDGTGVSAMGDRAIQIQWVTNQVFSIEAAALDPAEGLTPGFVEAEALSGAPKTAPAAIAREEGSRPFIHIAKTTPDGAAELLSVPAASQQGGGYWIGWRMREDGPEALVRLRFEDDREQGVASAQAFSGIVTTDWTERSAYARSHVLGSSIQLQAGIHAGAGTLDLADILLLPIVEPKF